MSPQQQLMTQRQKILPNEKPPFTLKDLRDAIPKHCFKRDMVKSFRMLLVDLLCVAIAIIIVNVLDSTLVSVFCPEYETIGVANLTTPQLALFYSLRVSLWVIYSIYQGVTMTGLWVIAHECGHESFVESKLINDIVGYLVHTPLFVPYFSWQKSHGLHHHYTNNIQKDQVWVPEVLEEEKAPQGPKSALRNAWELILMSTVGWPLYILINATGPQTKSFVSHFWAGSEIFNEKEVMKVNASGLGLIAWIFIVYQMCAAWGFGFMARVYVAPLIVVFFFLTSITFLQHTDHRLPHYNNEEWSWLRGALCTVDRPMGGWIDHKLHYIHSHHVVHHLFSKLPSYNAPEATEALKKVCGDYYLKDETNFFVALWENYRECLSLVADADNEHIFWWKDFTQSAEGSAAHEAVDTKKDQ